MSCAVDAPACPHSRPLLYMPWLHAKLRLDPAFECTFWGEFFKLTPKQVCLVGLLYITLTAGITMTDSSLWNFYSHFNTSDGVQCYLPALLFPLCNHLWRQKTLPARCVLCLMSHCPQKIMCDFWPLNPYYQMDPALMWKSKYKVYLTNSRV